MRPLDDGHVKAVLERVRRDVVSRVAAADNDDLLALPLVLAVAARVARRVGEVALVVAHRELGHARLAREAGSEDEMVDLHLTVALTVAHDPD